MRMYSIKQAEKLVQRQLKQAHDFTLTVYTAKKDRYLCLCHQDNQVQLQETGYLNQVLDFDLHNPVLKAELKAAWRREFPRSRNVYVDQK